MNLFKNRKKFLIISLLVAIATRVVMTLYIPYFYRILTIISYVSLFLIYAIIGYGIIMFLHGLVLEPLTIYKKRVRWLEITTTVVLFVVLVVISRMTILSALTNQPDVNFTTILDRQSNIIYTSSYYNADTIIEQEIQTDNSLFLSGTEHIEGSLETFGVSYADWQPYLTGGYGEGDLIFDVYVEYDEYDNVLIYELYVSDVRVLTTENQEKLYEYTSVYKRISNLYIYDENGYITSITRNRTLGSYETDILEEHSEKTLKHYSFTEDELTMTPSLFTFTKGENQTSIHSDDSLLGELSGTCIGNTCEYNLLIPYGINNEYYNGFLKHEVKENEYSILLRNSDFDGPVNQDDIYSFTYENNSEPAMYLPEVIAFNDFNYRKLYGEVYSFMDTDYDPWSYYQVVPKDFGYIVYDVHNPKRNQERNDVLAVMFTEYWKRPEIKNIMDIEYVLAFENIDEIYTNQNNPLLVIN